MNKCNACFLFYEKKKLLLEFQLRAIKRAQCEKKTSWSMDHNVSPTVVHLPVKRIKEINRRNPVEVLRRPSRKLSGIHEIEREDSPYSITFLPHSIQNVPSKSHQHQPPYPYPLPHPHSHFYPHRTRNYNHPLLLDRKYPSR